MKNFPKNWNIDMVDTETFIDSMNRLMNSDNDNTSNSSTDDADPNKNQPSDTDQTQLSYTNLINDLLETHPKTEYGHFESYANAMYCKDCQMMLQPKYVSQIPCKMPEFIVQQDGTVTYVHAKCEKLDLTKYIHSIASESGSWEKTYWQVWSECHFLSCITCKFHYPVRNSAMCQYHPESPEYFPIGNLGLEQPIGRYPCCGERAFRFELVKNPFGCKFRMHIPNKENIFCERIVKLMCSNLEFTVANPPALNREHKFMKFVNLDPGIKRQHYQHWWVKLTLGANDYTHQPIISLGSNFPNCQKKKKNWKDLNKRKAKHFGELKKWANNKDKPTTANSKSSLNLKENVDISSQMSCEKLTSTKNLTSQGSFWKTQSLMTSIQDSQREQESLFFDQITVSLIKSRKGEKGLPGTPDQPCRDSYTLIRANMLAKIEANNKSLIMRCTKPYLGNNLYNTI